MKKLSTLCLALLSLLFAANAQTEGDYQSASSGNWSFAAAWERYNGTMFVAAPSAPTSNDGIIHILNGHNVTVNNSVTADQIVVDEGGILTLTQPLNLNDGIGDDLTVNGTWNFSSGFIVGPGNAVIETTGDLTFATGSDKFIAASITNNGTMNWEDGALYFYGPSVTVTNSGTFNINSNNYFGYYLAFGDETFINTGTITKSSASTTTFGMSTVNNSGTITLNDGTLYCNNDLEFSNGGTVDGAGNLTVNDDFILEGYIIGSGNLTINGSATWNYGTLARVLTIGVSGNLTVATQNDKFIYADITNNGMIDWQDGRLLFNFSPPIVTITNNGIFEISGGNNFSGFNVYGLFINTGTVTKSSADISGFEVAVINSGTINLNSGLFYGDVTNTGAINLNSGHFSGEVTNTGNLIFNTGTFDGSFNHNAGSVISGTGNFNGSLNLNIDLVFPATVIFSTSGQFIDGPGNLTVNNNFAIEGDIGGTGTLNLNANGTWNNNVILRRELINASGSTLTFATSDNRFILANITNNGTIDWQGGSLYFDAAATVTNNGSFNISNGSAFIDNGGPGTFINNGTITKSVDGFTYFWMSTMTNSTGATMMGVGAMDIAATTFNSNGFIAPGLSPGLLTIDTEEPLSAGSTLNIEMLNGSGPGTGHDQLLRHGDIILAGTLTVTETGIIPDGNYTIINPSGTVSGNFTTTNLPAGYTLQVNAGDVQLIKNVPLPLTLISFTAQKTSDKKVNLQWVTADEQNVSHFEIQRSADGVSYIQIAIVQALNNPIGGAYNYLDESPLSKTNHYRLRMVDLDASAKLSPVRMVKFTSNGGVLVFPTITRDKVHIQTDEKVMVRLYSVSGVLLQQKQIADNDFIGLSHLSAGMYLLRIGEEGQPVKIIKQ